MTPLLMVLSVALTACGPFWHFETLDGTGATNAGATTGSRVDPAGITYAGGNHVFTRDVGTGRLRHAWWDGTRWSYENLDGPGTATPGHSDVAVYGSTTAIVSGTELHVFYQAYDGSVSLLRHAWFTPGVGWQAETLDGSLSPYAGHAGGSGFDTSAVVYHGALHVFTVGGTGAFDWNALRHLWWTGTTWRMEVLDGVGATVAVGRNSAASVSFGSNTATVVFADGPHVFYRQGNSPAQLRHAFYTPGTGWTAHTIDGPGAASTPGAVNADQGYSISALLYAGGPHVFSRGTSATSAGPSALRHAYWNGTTWRDETLDGTGGIATGAITETFDGGTAATLVGGLPQVWSNACTSCVGTSPTHKLRHASWTGSTWADETLDGPTSTSTGAVTGQGEGEFDKSVVIFDDGPHVFYTGSPSNATFAQALRHAWFGP